MHVRRLAYVGKALMTPRFRTPGHTEKTAVFVAKYPRKFRRAFVETCLAHPFEVRQGEGRACTFFVGGNAIAELDAHGQLHWGDKHLSPLSLAPKNIRALVDRGMQFFWDTLTQRYAHHLGLPDDALKKLGCYHPDGNYWYPETQRQLDAAKSCAEFDRIEDLMQEHNQSLLYIDASAGGFAMSKCRRMQGMAIRAVKIFCATLTAQQRKSLRRAATVGTTHREIAVGVTHRRSGDRWLQALDAYPALLRIAWFDQEAQCSIKRTIRRGLPLVKALADSLGLPEAAVRRFRGVTPQRLLNMPRDPLPALRFIAALPPHLRPVTRADYRAAFRLHEQLASWPSTRFSVRDLLQESGDVEQWNIAALTRGMKLPLGQERRIDALNGIQDVMVSMNAAFGEERAEALFRALPLGRLADLNAGWHRAQQQAVRIAAARANNMPEARWPGLLGSKVDLGNDRHAVDLTSMQELVLEGNLLSHCVGGYYPECFSGRSRIVSLRSADGTPSSTIEFRAQRRAGRGIPRLTIVQHYGHRNRAPSPVDRAAAKALLSIVRAKPLQAWPALPTPPSLEQIADSILDAQMTAFVRTWFAVRDNNQEQRRPADHVQPPQQLRFA